MLAVSESRCGDFSLPSVKMRLFACTSEVKFNKPAYQCSIGSTGWVFDRKRFLKYGKLARSLRYQMNGRAKVKWLRFTQREIAL
jgi:hypothetical protein